MVNEHTVDYHPSLSKLNSRIPLLIFLRTPMGFIFAEYFLNFFLNLSLSPWLRKSYGINGVKITDKYIFESKK